MFSKISSFLDNAFQRAKDFLDGSSSSNNNRSTPFQNVITQFANYSGSSIVMLREASALLKIIYNGRRFDCFCSIKTGRFVASVESNIQFPLEAIPSAILGIVRDLNRDLERFQFDTIDFSDYSAILTMWAVRPEELSLPLLQRQIDEMAHAVGTLDDVLVRHGYAK
jgi:hypothetical protein